MRKIKNLTAKKLVVLIVGFLLLVATVSGVLFGAKTARAGTDFKLNYILQNLSTNNVEINNDSFEIYGNSSLTDKEFRNIVNTGSPKIYLHYRTDRNIDLPYDALLEVKTTSKTYSYEFVEKEATDANSILNGISSFISKYSHILSGDKFYAIENNAPMTLSAEVPTTFIDCVVEKEYVVKFDKVGYIVYHIAVSRYTVNSESILFIVTVKSFFVPGVVAQKNGEEGYGNYKNAEGYVHMTVEQAYDANEEAFYGRRWGNIPYKKDFWPLNHPSTVTVTSSMNNGITLGYSTANGFSFGSNIVYGYSKAITQDNPAFSAQVNSSNQAKCEWNYAYDEDKAESYNLTTNYMFEISNSCAGLFIGDFRLKLDYNFVVGYKGFIKRFTKTRTTSADLMVRAGELRRIYDFCSGMI